MGLMFGAVGGFDFWCREFSIFGAVGFRFLADLIFGGFDFWVFSGWFLDL